MVKDKLSIIMPGCCEHPQVLFTIRSIVEELEGRCDFHIYFIDNFCSEVASQGCKVDSSSEHLEKISKIQPWLTYLTYKKKLSHWNSKNVGVQASDGEFLWFVDAHCMVGKDSLFDMFNYYKSNHARLNGTIHLPLTYHILEKTRLIYRLDAKPKDGVLHYSFMNLPPQIETPIEVPVMSTCGMMMTRALYDELKGWPPELGIYGGGENYVNFGLAVLGRKKWIYPARALYHHGDKRSYHYRHDDYVRNRVIALYAVAGHDWAKRFLDAYQKMVYVQKDLIFRDVRHKCGALKDYFETTRKVSIENWLEDWKVPYK